MPSSPAILGELSPAVLPISHRRRGRGSGLAEELHQRRMSSRVGRTGRLPQCSIGAGETVPCRLWDWAKLPSQLLQREIAFALITRPAGSHEVPNVGPAARVMSAKAISRWSSWDGSFAQSQ